MYSVPTISPEVNGLNETLAAMKGSLGNLGVRVCFLDLLYFTEGSVLTTCPIANVRYLGSTNRTDGADRWRAGDSVTSEQVGRREL